jgi:N6-adenosine-specific RNA methylase IME4
MSTVIPLSRSNLASAQVTITGLNLPDDLPIEEWAAIGDALMQADRAVQWWIGDWWAYGEQHGKRWGYGERSQLLEELRAKGHNPPALKTCINAGALARQFTTARRQAVLSFEHHAAVRGLDEFEQDWLLGRAKANDWTRAELRDEVRRFKVEKIRRPGEHRYETQTVEDLRLLIAAGKRFGTVYADPPWPYGNQGTRAATSRHYKAHNDLSVEDICNLPVPELTAEAAHLHLWTTNGFLFEARDVLEAWGFTYKSCFVWFKPDFGIGNYWRVGHEFMLFGMKGKAPFLDNAQQSWIFEKAGEHSVKPEKVRRIIEKTSPGPRLELFGRVEVPNWTVWGNEIAKEIDESSLFYEAQGEDPGRVIPPRAAPCARRERG